MYEIEALKTQIQTLNAEIDRIKDRPPVVVQAPREKTVQEQVAEKRKITKEDTRAGRDPEDFDPEQVSVENVFYYGNKK